MTQVDTDGINALLELPPGEDSWQTIWKRLQHLEDTPENQALVQKAQDKLSSWPNHLRFVFITRNYDLQRFKQSPASALVRWLRCRSDAFNGMWMGLDAFLALPLFDHLERLEIVWASYKPNGGNQVLQTITNTQQLASITQLCLRSCRGIERSTVEAFSQSALMARLNHLGIASCGMTDEAAAPLVTSPGLGRLETLDLSGNKTTAQTLALLARSPHLGKLRFLAFDAVDGGGAKAIQTRPGLSNLEHLRFSSSHSDLKALLSLLDAPHMTKLKRLTSVKQGKTHDLITWNDDKTSINALSFAGSYPKPGDFLTVSKHERLGDLKSLDLTGVTCSTNTANVSANDFADLFAQPMPSLHTVTMDHCWLNNRTFPLFWAKPGFEQVRTLSLSHNSMLLHGITHNARPAWPKLEALDLNHCRIGDGQARHMAQWELPNLHTLNLADNTLTASGMLAFLQDDRWSNLKTFLVGSDTPVFSGGQNMGTATHLNFGNTHMTGEALGTLASVSNTPDIQHMDLSHNQIGNPGLCAFAQSPHFPALERLDLSHNAVGHAGLLELLRSPHFPKLHTLQASHNKITALSKLLKEPRLSQILHLELANNRLKDTGARALGKCPHLGALTHLDLSQTQMTSGGLASLLSNPALARLETLRLNNNAIDDDGMAALAAVQHLTQLTHLELGGNNITNAGVETLMATAWLGQIRTLVLSHNPISDAGIHAIAQSPHLAALQTLNLDGNTITADAANALAHGHSLSEALKAHWQQEADAKGYKVPQKLASNTRIPSELSAVLTQCRELLHGPPSESSWDTLWQMLSKASAAASQEIIVDYLARPLNAWPARLRGVRVDAAELDALTEHPGWPLVRHLRVTASELGDAKALASNPRLGGIVSLDLNHCGLNAKGALAIAQSPHLTGLTALDLSRNPLRVRGAKALAKAPFLNQLTHLALTQCHIGDSGLSALMEASAFNRLSTLQLARNRIDQGLTAMLGKPFLPQLDTLDLSVNRISDSTGQSFFKGADLSALIKLELGENNLGAQACGALAANATLGKLRTLDLLRNRLGPSGGQMLATSTHMTNLTWLNLYETYLGGGLLPIAQSTILSKVQYLDIGNSGVDVASVEALAKSPHVSNLKTLRIYKTYLRNAAAMALASSPHLGKLTKLGVSGMSDKAKQALRSSPHLKNVVW